MCSNFGRGTQESQVKIQTASEEAVCYLIESVRVCNSHKVLQGKKLSHLARWIISHSLKDELALADLDRQLVLCVLSKQGLRLLMLYERQYVPHPSQFQRHPALSARHQPGDEMLAYSRFRQVPGGP